MISSTDPEEEGGGTGRSHFLCDMHLCIKISYTTLGQRECVMYKQVCGIPFHYSVCRHVHEMSRQKGCTWTGWATTYMFPSPVASHDHTLGVVLLCCRVWPIQFLWVPLSIIQCMITSVLNTYHPFLAQIPYTHAHTPTHLVPVCLPYNLRLLIVLLIVLLWLNQIVYVCVCAHVCVCRLRRLLFVKKESLLHTYLLSWGGGNTACRGHGA